MIDFLLLFVSLIYKLNKTLKIKKLFFKYINIKFFFIILTEHDLKKKQN